MVTEKGVKVLSGLNNAQSMKVEVKVKDGCIYLVIVYYYVNTLI